MPKSNRGRRDKVERKSRSKRPAVQSALAIQALPPFLEALSPDECSEIQYRIRTFLDLSIGDPTEESLLEFKATTPAVARIIDFDLVVARLNSLDTFERSFIGVDMRKFFPELVDIYAEVVAKIAMIPNAPSKAQSFLKPIAQDATADAGLEAAVYLASQGAGELVDPKQLADAWHEAICRDIERGSTSLRRVPINVLRRAEARTLSLAEAAEVLRVGEDLEGFLHFRDEEQDHIDQTFFRAVDWFGVKGFEPWLASLASQLSVGPQGIDSHPRAGWYFFYWCRSDLALSLADRQGLESWFWALANGPYERRRPWRVYWENKHPAGFRDYVPIAGVILFAWHRIEPSRDNDDVVRQAIDLLFQTQTRSGGWPLLADDDEPSLMATYTAIHGLALAKPEGWERVAQRGADWLETQQKPMGYWSIDGGPTILLTVLVLDAIELARGGSRVTFRLPSKSARVGIEPELEAEPEYIYEGLAWHNPALPVTSSKPLMSAQTRAHPKIALIVATETELRQVLRVLLPRRRCKHVWKVVEGPDTFLLGRFGAFEAVISLCNMGTEGPSGSALAIGAAIRAWQPTIVILVGIAFGANRKKHRAGDVLVAEHLIPYEHQRIGDKPVFRNPVPPSSPALVNRFRHALDWTFNRPDGSACQMHLGPVLSGQKLVDNLEFKQSLINQFPNAIGGEMEGSGLWAAADRARKHWILVKAVCDWGDGHKHGKFQQLAAASAVSLCMHVLSDPHALDGLE